MTWCSWPRRTGPPWTSSRAAGLGPKVIDLCGDYRLSDPEVYKKWYGLATPDLENLAKAVYGIPELFRDAIARARPGGQPRLLPDLLLLALAPLFAKAGRRARSSSTPRAAPPAPGTEPTQGHPSSHLRRDHHPVQDRGASPHAGDQDGPGEGGRVTDRASSSPRTWCRSSGACSAPAMSHLKKDRTRKSWRSSTIHITPGAGSSDRADPIHPLGGRVQLLRDRARDGRDEQRRGHERAGQSGQGRVRTGDPERNIMFGLDETTGLDFPGLGV